MKSRVRSVPEGDWCVTGGLAVNSYCEPVYTVDRQRARGPELLPDGWDDDPGEL